MSIAANTAANAAAVVAIIAQTKRRLKAAGAISAETAKTPKELGFDERRLKSGKKWGVVATDDGRYYLMS